MRPTCEPLTPEQVSFLIGLDSGLSYPAMAAALAEATGRRVTPQCVGTVFRAHGLRRRPAHPAAVRRRPVPVPVPIPDPTGLPWWTGNHPVARIYSEWRKVARRTRP